MSCTVCGTVGAKFCIPCRRKFGGKVVRVSRPVGHRPKKKAASRRPRRSTSSAKPRGKHLSKEAFKRRMRAGKLKAARARARGGR